MEVCLIITKFMKANSNKIIHFLLQPTIKQKKIGFFTKFSEKWKNLASIHLLGLLNAQIQV